jgi:hypothetical protein
MDGGCIVRLQRQSTACRPEDGKDVGRTRRHQPISSEREHKLTHPAVNVTPNPTPFVDDAVTDLSTSKSTVSDLWLRGWRIGHVGMGDVGNLLGRRML